LFPNATFQTQVAYRQLRVGTDQGLLQAVYFPASVSLVLECVPEVWLAFDDHFSTVCLAITPAEVKEVLYHKRN
jgi:hypothetical protein